MNKYKGMTYTIRKDGRLMKKKQFNGKTYYLYSDNEKDLYNQYVDLNYKLNTEKISSNKILFKDYAEKWLILNSSGKSEATIKEYRYIIQSYLIKYFGNKYIDKIKREDIQKLQSDILDQGHTELAHKCIRFMKTICNEAIIDDYLIKNPCLNIKEPKLIHKEKEVLTKEQDKLLLESKNKYAPFFRIMRYTGMRREEIVALTLDDVKIKNKTISVNKAVSLVSNQPKLKETKNKKCRTIPILDIIYNDVESTLKEAKQNNQKYLFVRQSDKKILTHGSILHMTENICKDLGFNFTPHQLRHSFCTMLYYSGIKIKEAQNLMGHSSAKMVYDLYAHLDLQKEDTSMKINTYLNTKTLSKKMSKSK